MNSLHIALSGSSVARDTVSINRNYLSATWNCGATPTLLNICSSNEYIEYACKAFDGFIFCGGGDIDPIYYNQQKQPQISNVCPERDEFEYKLFRAIYKTGKPILGICRGMQIINVFLGGSLSQHVEGHMQEEENYVPTHEVALTEGSPLHKLSKSKKFSVNSFHHQAIYSLAESLIVDARCSNDRCIEAFHMPAHKFLYGLQWHPEALFDTCKVSQGIFHTFISACNTKTTNLSI